MNQKSKFPKNDHLKMIYDYKERVKKIGYFIWLMVLIIGILGFFYLKWYVSVFLAGLVLLASFLISYLQALKIEEISGVSIKDQEYWYKKTRHLFDRDTD